MIYNLPKNYCTHSKTNDIKSDIFLKRFYTEILSKIQLGNKNLLKKLILCYFALCKIQINIFPEYNLQTSLILYLKYYLYFLFFFFLF